MIWVGGHPRTPPSYSTNDPKGYCGDPRRGAAMGRPFIYPGTDWYDYEVDGEGPKLTLKEIDIDSGGYDCNGTYFGVGSLLYWVADDSGSVDFVIRAGSRTEAKEKIRNQYFYFARFYN